MRRSREKTVDDASRLPAGSVEILDFQQEAVCVNCITRTASCINFFSRFSMAQLAMGSRALS